MGLPKSAGSGLQRDATDDLRERWMGASGGHPDCEEPYLDVLAWIKYCGQYSGAVAGDWRGAVRGNGAPDAGDEPWCVGAGRDDVGAVCGDRRSADVGNAGA